MRNFILMIMVIAPLFCAAQFTKGDKAIGGSFSYSQQRTPPSLVDGYSYRSTYFSFSPNARFFVSEKISIGGGIGFETSNNSSVQPNYLYNNRSHGYSVNLTVRRYATLGERFLFSLGGSTNYGRSWSANSSSPTENIYQSYGFNVSPSFHFFPTTRWSIEGGIGYIGVARTIDKANDRKNTSFHANLGYLNFGIAYYLRK